MSKDLYEVIKARRSVRKFKADKVPKELVAKILDAANWAPSGMNEQPWEFAVVGGEALDRLRGICQEVIEARLPKEGRTDDQKEFARWFATLGSAPLAVIQYGEADTDQAHRKMVLESMAAAFQNMLLAAAAEGLGTCWMTGPLARQNQIHELLGLPDTKEIMAITPLGYPAQMPAPIARKDPDLKTKVKWIGC